MRQVLDLDSYPLHDLESANGRALVAACRSFLKADGMFDLSGFIRPAALARCVKEVAPLFRTASFRHRRHHNIYFQDEIPDIAEDHPALARLESANYTVCGDQIPHSVLTRIYEWPPLAAFIAATMAKPRLHLMADPLARINVMAYPAGEGLNWHFDRSEFTVTFLLQSPVEGGLFQYRPNLRTESDPNFSGVAELLQGRDGGVRSRPIAPGTFSLFLGKNTAHRVTPVVGDRDRIVAVFSFYETPGYAFTATERRGFYGRASVEESLS